MPSHKHVLVTGITGKQGGSVARALLAHGHRVRGMTRNPGSDVAHALTALGAEMVRGDFADLASLASNAAGMDAVFAVSTPFERGVRTEVEQGIALVEAAAKAGVGHFIYTSVASAEKQTGLPHFDSKHEVERHLASTALTRTVLAPVYFMENLFLPQTIEGLRQGTYATPLPTDLRLQQVAVDDIGEFGAHVIDNRDSFAGRRVEIAGDELTAAESAVILSTVLDRPVTPVQVPMDQIRAVSEDLALMYEWFIATGYSVDIKGLRATTPAVGWQRFADWAAKKVRAAV